MKKISSYFFCILFLYFLLAILKNNFDTDDYGAFEKIKFTSLEKGEFSLFGNYDLRVKSSNSYYGWIYISSKCLNFPKELILDREYSVHIFKFQAHSWSDFFKLGTRYDCKITKFSPDK